MERESEQRAAWYLYTIYAVDGRRMYVGITAQQPPQKRIVQHAQDQPWWHLVDETRTTIDVLFRGRPAYKHEARVHEAREIRANGGTLANKEDNHGQQGYEFAAHIEAGGGLDDWPPEQYRPTAIPETNRNAHVGPVIAALAVGATAVGALLFTLAAWLN